MISIFPEIFVGMNLLLLLVGGSILGSSPKYNYPNLCFQSFTSLILIWMILLCRTEISTIITSYFVIDNLSNNAKIFIILGLLGCIGISKTKKIKIYEYYVLILLGLLGLCFLASSLDLLSVYLCLELITLSFYILATFQRSSAFSTEAGLKYFLLGAISSGLLLFGASFTYGFSGTTNLTHLIYLYININLENQTVSLLIQSGLFFFCIGLLFKLGCVPFHIWVPDVYEGAPTYVTAIFSVLPKIAIFTVLIRLINATRPDVWATILLSLAFLSLFVGSLYALSQIKIKRLLAFSGISHVGYALLGLSISTFESFIGCILYLVIYMCTALFLWGLTLCVENKNGRTLYLTDLVHWGKTNITLAITTILVVFSLAGIPPLGGFFAKFAVFVSCAESSLYIGIIVGLLTSAIGILYYLRLVKLINFEEAGWSRPIPLKKVHALSIGISAFFLIFFVFFGDFIILITYKISLCA
jgi:NADH-quinone oxidoreductase subunit N